ncbi:MAG: methylmalonyl-CoA carboxyltransferase, partial [Rubrobacter sp.]|nr:methylmalonyl-CoA carboxyltransferase [Rubrobacter sp.]
MQGERLGEDTTAGKIEGLKRLRESAAHPASGQAVERQRERGKLTARERIALLLDEGTFVELDRYRVHRSNNFGLENNKPLGDGVVTGYGEV